MLDSYTTYENALANCPEFILEMREMSNKAHVNGDVQLSNKIFLMALAFLQDKNNGLIPSGSIKW
jgi:hypothetical protein